MATANTPAAAPGSPGRFRLPDPPKREPDEMTSYDHLHKTGNAHHLIHHFGNLDTTIVEGDRWIVADPGSARIRARRPDLFVAFDVDPVAYEASNGYVISEQGKPPDFVLEVASASTGRIDVVEKRDDYAALGIREYWRFDRTGEFHGARLSGEVLVNGVYVPLPLQELPDGSLQGYSAALNLYLRWEREELAWYDPATGRHILTYQDQRERAETAEDASDAARAEAAAARAEADEARARVRELEEEIRRLRGD